MPAAGIGLETVKAALLGGHRVRALARSETWLSRRSGRHLPSVHRRTHDAFLEIDRILVDAMKAAGVKRLVAVTGLGAGDSRGHGGILYDGIVFPLLLKRVYDDKDVQEWIIRSSGLDWTIVRPGLLTSGPAAGRYRVLSVRQEWRFGVISRADVANFLVRQIDDRTLIGATPLLIN